MSFPEHQLRRSYAYSTRLHKGEARFLVAYSNHSGLPPEVVALENSGETTSEKLANLMFQLQMTGYMLRNAEYVVTMRKVLGLKTRSEAEYRAACPHPFATHVLNCRDPAAAARLVVDATGSATALPSEAAAAPPRLEAL